MTTIYRSSPAIHAQGAESRFGVCGKEIPHNARRTSAGIRIKVGVVGNLAGNIHWNLVPGVCPSDQLVELYFRGAAAICPIFLHRRRDVALAVAQGGGCVEAGTAIRRDPVQ
jgi:hypothetical protein